MFFKNADFDDDEDELLDELDELEAGEALPSAMDLCSLPAMP